MTATLLLSTATALAAAPVPISRIGDTYEIVLTRDMAEHASNGTTGTSHDKDTFKERVIALRSDGLELEYDLPGSTTAQQRASNWQFPARIFKPFDGPLQLLNAPELEDRVEHWLKAAGQTHAICGKLIFTWNAFRVECDPQAVLKTVQMLDLGSANLHEGAVYKDRDARESGMLVRQADGDGGAVFSVEMPVDPESVRRARAETDVGLGELIRRPVSLDDALKKRAGENISGTISVAYQIDPTGAVLRRTRVTKVSITSPDGATESQTTTESLERRLVSQDE